MAWCHELGDYGGGHEVGVDPDCPCCDNLHLAYEELKQQYHGAATNVIKAEGQIRELLDKIEALTAQAAVDERRFVKWMDRAQKAEALLREIRKTGIANWMRIDPFLEEADPHRAIPEECVDCGARFPVLHGTHPTWIRCGDDV